MTELGTYLFFDGTCAEALRYYERTLGAKIEFSMRVSEAPPGSMPMPPGSGDKILHARLAIGGQAVMASDWCTTDPFERPAGFSMSLSYPTADEARRIFSQLADGGTVEMPIGPTFWADAFGSVTDRYGIPWMVNGGMKQT